MTENDFWLFLKDAQTQGRTSIVSGRIDNGNLQVQKTVKYASGHSILPENHAKIPKDKIIGIKKLLLDKRTKLSTKEAILMILAHHPSKEALSALKTYKENPDSGLGIFAELALQECEFWNE